MIDIENDIFTAVATALREEFPKIYVTGEYVITPPSFPCVSVQEIDNIPLIDTQTSDTVENHARLTYEINVYSNKQVGKKTECRTIAGKVDAVFAKFNFTRLMLNNVPNLEDTSIYRIVGRYSAVVDHTKTIYRR